MKNRGSGGGACSCHKRTAEEIRNLNQGVVMTRQDRTHHGRSEQGKNLKGITA